MIHPTTGIDMEANARRLAELRAGSAARQARIALVTEDARLRALAQALDIVQPLDKPLGHSATMVEQVQSTRRTLASERQQNGHEA